MIKKEVSIPNRYKVESLESLTLVTFLVVRKKFLTESSLRDQNEWWLTVLRNTVRMTGADLAMAVDWSVVSPRRQGKGKARAQLLYFLVSFFIQSKTRVHGMVLSIWRVTLPSHMNFSGNILTDPLRHAPH